MNTQKITETPRSTSINVNMYKTFDLAIDSALTGFNNELEKVSFDTNEAIYFTLNDDTDIICSKSHNFSGVYFFEIKAPREIELGKKPKTKLQNFKKLWSHRSYHGKWTPSIKDIRLNAHEDIIDDWIPLYIGKSKFVGNRINEHITKDLGKTTFAMKLKARKNLYGFQLRVSFIRIEVKNYNMIVPHVEGKLRTKYNPIVGRQ